MPEPEKLDFYDCVGEIINRRPQSACSGPEAVMRKHERKEKRKALQ